MQTIDNSNIARQLMQQHSNFLISPNIDQYASSFLTSSEQAQARSIIEEGMQVTPAKLKQWLLQATSDKKHYSEAIRIAIANGEPEDSDYIQVWLERYHAAVKQEAQLEALTKTNQAA